MIAEVVLNSLSRATGNVYHYTVPPELEQRVRVGVRVIVPFGRANKQIEAYVLGMCSESEYKNLKPISSVADDYSYFDTDTAELIKFMSHRYFSSLISAVKAVVPSGVGVHIQSVYTRRNEINDTAKKYLLHSLRASAIYDFLSDGAKSADEIQSHIGGKSITSVLKNMLAKGVVSVKQVQTEGVKDTLCTRVSLCVDITEAIAAAEAYGKRAPARARCLEIMAEFGDLSLRELLEFASTGRETVKALSDRGYIRMYQAVSREDLFADSEYAEYKKRELTEQQKIASDTIYAGLKSGEFCTYLLKGVTGSGKTEVYLDLIEKTIATGRQAVFLVPEISLTPQMVRQVTSRFAGRVAVIHSSLTQKQRYEQWKNIRDGNVDIAVGARSAVFAPFANPGLFIIDEEHENTYKSELSPKYSTAEVARFRASRSGATVVLASATPLVESMYKAQNGKYRLVEMNSRVNDSPLPDTEIVDMRTEMSDGNMSIFSRRLVEEISENLSCGRQTILFLNRRGFSNFVSCRECGYVMECPNCNVSLTYHKTIGKMVCHYCDYVTDVPSICPSCGSRYIKYFGIGTQRVADELGKLFPSARVIRMDADTTSGRFDHEQLLDKFRNHEADILVGTQMITKGLDFEDVTLVGIVAADMSLNMDDYRAAERTFDLITQVTGRAGRGKYRGRAIIQTYNPDNETLVYAAAQDYGKFYNEEIEVRKVLLYPPFCEFINFVFVSSDRARAERTAAEFASELRGLPEADKLIMYPVAKAPLFRINGKYRYRFLVKSRYSKQLYNAAGELYDKFLKNKNSSQIIIDVNPSNMY